MQPRGHFGSGACREEKLCTSIKHRLDLFQMTLPVRDKDDDIIQMQQNQQEQRQQMQLLATAIQGKMSAPTPGLADDTHVRKTDAGAFNYVTAPSDLSVTARGRWRRSRTGARSSHEYAAAPLWEVEPHIHFCNERYHVTAQYRKKMQRWKKQGLHREQTVTSVETGGTSRGVSIGFVTLQRRNTARKSGSDPVSFRAFFAAQGPLGRVGVCYEKCGELGEVWGREDALTAAMQRDEADQESSNSSDGGPGELVREQLDSLCRELNLDQETAAETMSDFTKTWSTYSLEGDVKHWLACALYAACRKGFIPTVGRGVMEGNGVSLTRILRSAKLSLIQFFNKMKKWMDMSNLPQDFRERVERLERNFEVSTVIFKKFEPIFMDIFQNPHEELPRLPRSRKQRKLQCNAKELFNFCWTLFVYTKGNFSLIGDDLVNSYHLLLCCLDLVYSHTLQCSYKDDLLNPSFTAKLSTSDNDDGEDPPCVISTLCDYYDGLTVEAKGIKQHYFKPYISRLYDRKVRGRDDAYSVRSALCLISQCGETPGPDAGELQAREHVTSFVPNCSVSAPLGRDHTQRDTAESHRLKPSSGTGTPERSVQPHSNTWSRTLRSGVPVPELVFNLRDSAVSRCSVTMASGNKVTSDVLSQNIFPSG
ncbi:unnamed protein product [Ranitomeya imitator]|uniref:Retinoblastoma-associated protein N-terminal domain-containing protein n=1 Tax=Ranitomeya imitator TaxID=111125 RepID=A0ABN9KPU2_9NEOB|nr:unnamed protein product [Ranitomeya imitator]